jgi:hypothetical protein
MIQKYVFNLKSTLILLSLKQKVLFMKYRTITHFRKIAIHKIQIHDRYRIHLQQVTVGHHSVNNNELPRSMDPDVCLNEQILCEV